MIDQQEHSDWWVKKAAETIEFTMSAGIPKQTVYYEIIMRNPNIFVNHGSLFLLKLIFEEYQFDERNSNNDDEIPF